VAFGLGPRSPDVVGPHAPKPRAAPTAARVDDPEAAWRSFVRVTSALADLEHLAAARADARRVVEGLDEEIEVAVDHLRVDGASWVQIGRALGISRQGARQRFG